MKKLYQGKARRVHPAPSPVALPAAVLALASALTPEEQEVLAYLLSCGGAAGARPRRRRGTHQPEMGCACFGCYKSFWARWDASPNRHLIHRIIDAVEEGGGGGGAAPSRRRRRGRRCSDADKDTAAMDADVGVEHHHHPDCRDDNDAGRDGEYEGDGDDEEEGSSSSVHGDDEDDDSVAGDGDCNGSVNAEVSTVGRLVRFIGEKVWGAWN